MGARLAHASFSVWLPCQGQVRRKSHSLGTQGKHTLESERKTGWRTRQDVPREPRGGSSHLDFSNFSCSQPLSPLRKLHSRVPRHPEVTLSPMPGPGHACRTGRMCCPQALHGGGQGVGGGSHLCPPALAPRAGPTAAQVKKDAANTQQITLCPERLPSITSLVPPTFIDSICSFCS